MRKLIYSRAFSANSWSIFWIKWRKWKWYLQFYSYINLCLDDFISFDTATPTPTYPTPKSFILAYSDVVNRNFHDAFILGALSLFPSNAYNSSNFADVLFDINETIDNSSVQIQTNFL